MNIISISTTNLQFHRVLFYCINVWLLTAFSNCKFIDEDSDEVGIDWINGIPRSSLKDGTAKFNSPLDRVPDIELDPDGLFKLAVIKVSANLTTGPAHKYVYRGTARLRRPVDIFNEAKEEFQKFGVESTYYAWSRIHVDAKRAKIMIYGLSYEKCPEIDRVYTMRVFTKYYKKYFVDYFYT